jgi:RNA polymerase sigma factor (sigma-70 family)
LPEIGNQLPAPGLIEETGFNGGKPMKTGLRGAVLQHIRKLVGPLSDLDQADRRLLDRFVSGHDENAFATLVEKHGPMVLGVCRRVLPDAQDADDAFQATFLVLIRKAAFIKEEGRLAGWLYTVAYHAALKAKAAATRRRLAERQVLEKSSAGRLADRQGPDLRSVLDAELARLPEKYRLPLMLCYLQGKTNEQAAQELGWPTGTVKGRMARARELLRSRLSRRGMPFSPAALASVVTSEAAPAAVPRSLAEATMKAALTPAAGSAAAGALSAPVRVLTEEVLKATVATRSRLAVALVGCVVTLAGAAGLMGPYTFIARPTANHDNGDWSAVVPAADGTGADASLDAGADDLGEPGSKEKALAKLEAMSLEKWDAAWKQDLDVAGQSVGVVLRNLTQPLGLELDLTPAQEQALRQPITVTLRGRCRLELVEAVCRRVDLYPVYPGGVVGEDPGDKKLRLEKGPRPRPAAFAGPFLVETEGIKEFPAYSTGKVSIRFIAVGLPPAVGLLLPHGRAVLVEKVSGPGGQDLQDRTGDWTSSGTESYDGFDQTEDFPLKGLLRPVTAIHAVEGKIRLSVASGVASLPFPELVPGAHVKNGEVEITLHDIKPGAWTVNGREQSREDFDFRSRNAEPFRLGFVARDAGSKLLGCVWHSATRGNETLGFARRPASITAKVITDLKTVDYPFRLENIALTAHAQAPETRSAVQFPGHDEPVSVEFIQIVPDPPPSKIECRVVNHSDKDIRKLHLELTYLDARGRKLKDFPLLQTPPPLPHKDVPIVVARHDAAVFQATAAFMPPTTTSVRVQVRQVEFADATEWKAPGIAR